MQVPKPSKEHQWLHKLIGEWTIESECRMGPDQPPMKNTGKETVRSLGGLWAIGEGEGELPNGESSQSIMTLGYNPQLKRFVGSFIASCMTHLWPYSGSLDAQERVLTLDSEGPSFADEGTSAQYQDIIEFLSDDHRTLTSRYRGSDGQWVQFMKADYRRVK